MSMPYHGQNTRVKIEPVEYFGSIVAFANSIGQHASSFISFYPKLEAISPRRSKTDENETDLCGIGDDSCTGFRDVLRHASQSRSGARTQPGRSAAQTGRGGASRTGETGGSSPRRPAIEGRRLRKQAFDLGLNGILPEDYAAAEKAFADGKPLRKGQRRSAASYTDAASRFQDVIAKGMPFLAEKEKKHASDLRSTAVGKRSGELFPELFAYAEAEFAKPSEAEAAGDFGRPSTGSAHRRRTTRSFTSCATPIPPGTRS